MKFVVDGMLGGLARWLRMLGHEVLYDANAADNSLLAMAKDGGMILLTRDEELYHRAVARKLPSLLVSGRKEEDMLAEVAMNFSINLVIDMANTRCPECGAVVKAVSKGEVAGQVPAKSLKLYTEFWKCENHTCGKVYWMGSHWEPMSRTLAQARQILGLDM